MTPQMSKQLFQTSDQRNLSVGKVREGTRRREEGASVRTKRIEQIKYIKQINFDKSLK